MTAAGFASLNSDLPEDEDELRNTSPISGARLAVGAVAAITTAAVAAITTAVAAVTEITAAVD